MRLNPFHRGWRQPSVREIGKAVSRVADEFGYGNVWLFGNYYIEACEERDPIQLMLDSEEEPRHMMAFADRCSRATGLETQLYLTCEWPEKTEYILANSRLIHRARTSQEQADHR